jgi:hypothetical protein
MLIEGEVCRMHDRACGSRPRYLLFDLRCRTNCSLPPKFQIADLPGSLRPLRLPTEQVGTRHINPSHMAVASDLQASRKKQL